MPANIHTLSGPKTSGPPPNPNGRNGLVTEGSTLLVHLVPLYRSTVYGPTFPTKIQTFRFELARSVAKPVRFLIMAAGGLILLQACPFQCSRISFGTKNPSSSLHGRQ